MEQGTQDPSASVGNASQESVTAGNSLVPDQPSNMDNEITSSSPNDNETEEDVNSVASDSSDMEPTAVSPVEDHRLKAAMAELEKETRLLTASIKKSDLTNDMTTQLYKLLEHGQNLSIFKRPATRSVGFIGDSGVGKSSVINSILDEKGIARSGGSGGACTCVATEFRYVDQDHPVPYTIESIFMGAKERTKLLEELVIDFRTWYCNPSDITASEPSENNCKIQAAADRAWSMLEPLFKNQPKFDRDFILSQNTLASILKKLDKWAPTTVSNERIIADGLDDCKSHLDNLTSLSSNRQRSASWIFIKLIRVYLGASILKTGLILADLPGFRDTNKVRVKVTRRYLQEICDEVFIVTSILRCCSDQSIREIQDLGVKHKRIVCTRSEDINAEEYCRDPHDIPQTISEISQESEDVETQLKRARCDMAKADDNEKQQFHSKLFILGEKMEGLQLKKKKYLIDHRNKRVTDELQKQYDVLGIFCVSNELYWNSHDGSLEESRALSGIPELQHHCQRLITDAQIRAINEHLKFGMTLFLGSIRQWATAATDDASAIKAAASCQALKSAADYLDAKMISEQSLMACLKRKMIELFDTLILWKMSKSYHSLSGIYKANVIRENCHYDWGNQWNMIIDNWEALFHGTYGAFCRKDGIHHIPSSENHSWNSELGECIDRDLSSSWDEIDEWLPSVEQLKDEFEQVLQELIDKLKASLSDSDPSSPSCSNISHLIATIVEPTKHRILRDVELFTKDLRMNINLLHRRMHAHDSPRGFMGKAMRPIYKICRSVAGVGCDKQRKSDMREFFEDTGPYPKYHESTEEFFKSYVEQKFQDFHSNIGERCQQLSMAIRRIVAGDDAPAEAQMDRETASALLRLLETAEPALEKAKQIFDTIDHDYKANVGGKS